MLSADPDIVAEARAVWRRTRDVLRPPPHLSPDSGVELVVCMKPVQVGLAERLLNTAAFYLAHVLLLGRSDKRFTRK